MAVFKIIVESGTNGRVNALCTSMACSIQNQPSSVKSDVQVQKLQSQIQDWRTCPTTDAKTKQTIVTRLEAQLDSVVASLESSAKMSGKGRSLDLAA